MSKIVKPSEDTYWSRNIEDIAKTLPGELLLTEDGILIISKVEAFRELVRKAMSEDFESTRKTREPGDLFVTQFRGAPLINVTGRTDKSVPEVVWIREMEKEGQKVTGSALARSIAENAGLGDIKGQKLMDFCMKELDGKNVQDPKSPIRIVENIDAPVEKRKIGFSKTAGNASNSEGIATLDETVRGVESIEQARVILRLEAAKLRMTPEEFLNPAHMAKMTKKSAMLLKVLKFFSA